MVNKKNKAVFTGFLREFAKIFTLMLLSMSLAGKLIFAFNHEFFISSNLFSGGSGLTYTTIFQSAGFALIMAALSRFLFSNIIKYRISIMLRSFLFFLAAFSTVSIFSVIFKWIPLNNLQAWFIFFIAFLVFYFLAIGASLLLLKLEDKKYNKLLERYKKKYNG
jgi:hypothetical protein